MGAKEEKKEDPRRDEPEAPSCCDYKTLVGVFKALSDVSRQKILVQLEESSELRVSDLVERLGISQPTMSHHMGVLKHAGLVNDRRSGQSVYYSVNRSWLSECCSGFMSQFEDDDQD